MKYLASLLFAAVLIVMPSARARACVALLQQQGGVVEQGGQVALLSVHDDVTDHVFVINVPSADNAFGVLIPVPAEPTIDPNPVSTDAIDALEEQTRPTFSTGEDSGGGGGCGCAAPLAGDFANNKGVVEGEAVDIGPVTAQWVSGASGDAVSDWLSDQGFDLPAGAQDVLDGYIAQGMSFLSFTRNETATGAARVGVKFTLDGDRRVYALPMAQIGAAGEMAFSIFVATESDEPVAPDGPYAEIGVDELGEGGIIADGDYRAAVKALVAEAGGQAFVVESFGPAANLSADAAALFFDGAYVTRLSTVADPAGFDVDVTFMSTSTKTVQSFAGLATPDARPWKPRLDLSLSFLWLALGLRALSAAWQKRAAASASAVRA